jgi:hypothetical protein
MSRLSSVIAALAIAGLVFLGGAGTALAATPTTGAAAQPAPSATPTGARSLLADCKSPAGCPGGGYHPDTGEDTPENGPRHRN